jgi:hypothetical protein
MSELIVMLTHNDVTVKNAIEVFEECKNTQAKFWGFKEEGLPLNDMKKLCRMMKDAGKTTFLEVVAYTEKECLEGAQKAVACGFEILMGTMFSDSVNDFAKGHGIKYMPFVGKIEDRPSVLKGTIEDIIEEGNALKEEGVFGIDLLGYRFVGDAVMLNQRAVAEIDLPVCLAGSVSGYQRLDEVKAANPWAFTIGGAFFENKFGGTIAEQIDKVLAYMKKV